MSREIRSVNGFGPRCGCGGVSTVHLTSKLGVITPETSTFLCSYCVETAVAMFLGVETQPPYWPGDEDRDEPPAVAS